MARAPGKPRLWMLAGVVAAVVLAGLSNLTQMFLVRGARRSRGLAVRAALGGGTWQIGRGLMAEGVLIGIGGGALGLALTSVGKDVARSLLGSEYAAPTGPSLGAPVVVFALALVVFGSIMVAAEPARRLRRLDLQGLLQRRSAGSTTTVGERRSQRAMVAIQLATSVVLVAIAAVFGSAYRSLHALDLGYAADSVVQAVPDYELARMGAAEQWEVARTVAARLRGRPGIEGVGVWEAVGMDYPPRPEFEAVFDAPTRELGPFESLYLYYAVDPGFFEALGVEVIAGRELTAADGPGVPPAALVTRKGAEAWWPGEDPLGRQLKLGQEGTWMTVIGVTEDVASLDQLGPATAMQGRHRPFAFIPASQLPLPPVGWRRFDCCDRVMVGVRPALSTGLAAEALRAAFADVAPSLAVDVGTMTSLQVTNSYAGAAIALTGRLVATGMVVATLLALFGVVGVLAEALTRRTREIGIRRALGATKARIVAITAREVVTTVGLGITVGLLALFFLDRTLGSVLFDYYTQRLTTGVIDPPALAATAALVGAAAMLTALAASRRAATIDPAVALRNE
jgi:predicted permease